MGTIPAVEVQVQDLCVPEVPARKIGTEIVPRADVGQHRYHGPRPGRRSLPSHSQLSRRDLSVVLCGQLRWLREQVERGNQIPIDSLRRAERLAQ
jgi:hypothetical protein